MILLDDVNGHLVAIRDVQNRNVGSSTGINSIVKIINSTARIVGENWSSDDGTANWIDDVNAGVVLARTDASTSKLARCKWDYNGSYNTWADIYPGGFRGGIPTTLSGAGAIPLIAPMCHYTSTGAAQALTLADGVEGQRIEIVHIADGGDGDLTATSMAGWSNINLAALGDTITLEFTSAAWFIAASNGVTITP